MKLTLRNFFVASVAVAAIGVAANSAMAETKVNVPFNFKVGSRFCPAGQYVVAEDAHRNFVTLTSTDSALHFTMILIPGNTKPMDTAVVLRFGELDQTHILRSIQFGPLATPRMDKGSDRLEHRVVQVMPGQ